MRTVLTRRSFLANIVAAFAASMFSMIPGVRANEAVTHHVEIRSLDFTPASLLVHPGDTIIWTNRDIIPHTATASDMSWTTGFIGHNESKKLIVEESLTASYFCEYHPSMVATLQFEAEATGSSHQ